RAEQLLPQLAAPRAFAASLLTRGVGIYFLGFIQKAYVADFLAEKVVDRVFTRPDEYTRGSHWLALFGYAAQVFCDFSGYSLMAIGTGRLFGLELPENFNYPFLSKNLTEFWRRWHISLTSWFRDYVYKPLGGNKVGRGRRVANVIATFTISGLWHGANWTFVAWGLLNGIAVLPGMLRSGSRRTAGDAIAPGRVLPGPGLALAMATTFGCEALLLVFFRSDTIGHAWSYLSELSGMTSPGTEHRHALRGLGLAGVMVAVEWMHRDRRHGLDVASWPVGYRWGAYCVVALVILLLGNLGSVEFVYFQF
ncbi:MAG TPA: MBOAT family O-acyltransferase, partial [Gemmatimonadales bacterium]